MPFHLEAPIMKMHRDQDGSLDKGGATRRELLRAAGAAGFGAALAGCGEERDEFEPNKPEVPGAGGWALGEERQIATACGQCEAGCGVVARVLEGRVLHIAGNTSCPINRGGIGPRGLSGPQVLYDPDRIPGPLVLDGPRGSGRWRKLTWDEGLAMLVERLAGLREAGTPERLGILLGRERGFVREFWQRFAAAYGTPNLIDAGRTNDGAQIAAMRAMQGISELPAYDWENTRLVVSLGSDVLDASCQNLHFARLRRHDHELGGRATILHIGPVLSRTAMDADEWIQTEPGTNAAFALGLAHVLVRDDLFDHEFVATHCLGFEPYEDATGRKHLGLRELLERYTPEYVGQLTGATPEKIVDVARCLAEVRPSLAIAGSDELKSPSGVQTAMAVHALNALLGAIDRPGGLLVQASAPLADWSEFEPDELAEEGLDREPVFAGLVGTSAVAAPQLDLLPEALLSGKPYRFDTFLLDTTNPLYSRAGQDLWRRALESIPFLVSFSPFMDETTEELADLILPDDTWLERMEDSASAPSLGRAVFGMRQPLVERLLDTRSTGDVILSLASELGEGVGEAFPFKDFRSAFKKRVVGLYKAKTGSIVESKGSAFLKRLYAEGFWSGEAYEFEDYERVLATDSGRFEFFSNRIWEELEARAEAVGQTIEEYARAVAGVDDPDLLCLPGHRELPLTADAEAFPLLLLPYRPHTFARGSGANLPWLAGLAPWHGRKAWGTEVELHPETAAKYGIEHGRPIELVSPMAVVRASAYLNPGIRRGVVRAPLGGGHRAFGRFAKGVGANVMELIEPGLRDPLGGSSVLHGTRITIRRGTV